MRRQLDVTAIVICKNREAFAPNVVAPEALPQGDNFRCFEGQVNPIEVQRQRSLRECSLPLKGGLTGVGSLETRSRDRRFACKMIEDGRRSGMSDNEVRHQVGSSCRNGTIMNVIGGLSECTL